MKLVQTADQFGINQNIVREILGSLTGEPGAAPMSMAQKFMLLSTLTFLLPLGFFVFFSYRNYSSAVDSKLFQMTENVWS